MKSPANELAEYLQDNGVGAIGGVENWRIGIGSEPASPVDCVTIYDTGDGELFSDIYLEHSSVQVRTRSENYIDGFSRQLMIRNLLVNIADVEIGDSFYIGVRVKSNPVSIGKTDNGNFLLTANYWLERQQFAEVST